MFFFLKVVFLLIVDDYDISPQTGRSQDSWREDLF